MAILTLTYNFYHVILVYRFNCFTFIFEQQLFKFLCGKRIIPVCGYGVICILSFVSSLCIAMHTMLGWAFGICPPVVWGVKLIVKLWLCGGTCIPRLLVHHSWWYVKDSDSKRISFQFWVSTSIVVKPSFCLITYLHHTVQMLMLLSRYAVNHMVLAASLSKMVICGETSEREEITHLC